MALVQFHYADIGYIRLEHKRKAQQFIVDILQSENKQVNRLDYIFCSESYMLELNRTFLNHDYYTDIITFDLSVEEAITAELYIGVDTIKSNAILHNSSYKNELLRVLFHGALHLCGYKDKTKSEITLMRQKEDYYLKKYLKF